MKDLTNKDLDSILMGGNSGMLPLMRSVIAADRALNAPADRDVMRQTVEDIDAILYQCDRKTVSIPWLIDCLKGLKERAGAPTPPAEQRDSPQDAEVIDLIVQRDHREEIIDQLCDAVLGPDRAEWSSAYYFEDAVSEVQERIAELETCKECRESNMSAEQGEQEPVATVNSMDGHTNTKWLTKLPDGQHNLYIRPAPDVLATLRAKVEELPSYRGVLWAIRRNDALALIDKMGGAV